jgi:hypothetical protein
MSEPAPTPSRASCPHCGKPPGLRWVHFFPSNARGRVFKCQACGGGYDLSDGCKMAGMLGALIGMGPAILLFGRIVKAGHGAGPYVVAGTAVVIGGFALGSALVTWISLKLVRK